MPGPKRPEPPKARLSPQALDDLERLWLQGARRWSPSRANAYVDELDRVFDLLAANPFMARERTEFSPPVRVHPHGSHVIVYRVTEGDVVIMRIRHGREGWVEGPG